MQADEQAIRQFVLSWGKASENGDVGQLQQMIADDAIFLTAGQPPMSKSDFFAAMEGMKSIKLRVRSDIQEVKLMGDWAWCWNKLTVQITVLNGNPPLIRAGNTLSVLRKQNGAWVLVRDANMLTMADAA